MANLPTSIKNLNTLLGEQLTEGGGGGGSSDFSTAKVTITNALSADAVLIIPCVHYSDDISIASPSPGNLSPGSTITVDVILYNGSAKFLVPDGTSTVVESGDIIGSGADVTIMGDGSIMLIKGGSGPK